MTPHHKSQDSFQVTRPMPLMTTRAVINIGAWNVRTISETGRANQIATKMRRYNLTLLGISEIHWTQSGQQRPKSEWTTPAMAISWNDMD